MSENTKLKPIIYDNELVVRFADLDSYGHVNTTHYMDYVISSRFQFLSDQFQITAADLIKKGLGFFLKRFEINFIKPIDGREKIRVISYVEKMEGSLFEVVFKITDVAKQKTHCEGKFDCIFIDLTTVRPSPIPAWFQPYLFE